MVTKFLSFDQFAHCFGLKIITQKIGIWMLKRSALTRQSQFFSINDEKSPENFILGIYLVKNA